ncbi:MAG: hypothetical protein IMZ44_07795 [Planctomycetes bacterium]|nr:hypothetical protein [Planctomycetota bacterium]
MDLASARQLEFLRNLGHQGPAPKTKREASALIDRLLAQNSGGGIPFCPKCGVAIPSMPMQLRRCPQCRLLLVPRSGRYHCKEDAESLDRDLETRQAAIDDRQDAVDYREWWREERKCVRLSVTEDVKGDKEIKRLCGEGLTAGYRITIGPLCTQASRYDKVFLPIEVAARHLSFLPPYRGICTPINCQCDYLPVDVDEILSLETRMLIETGEILTIAEWKQRQRRGGTR